MSKKPDYNYKAFILNHYQKLLLAERKASLFSYSKSLFNEYGVVNYSMRQHLNGNEQESYQELKDYCERTNLKKEFEECAKINHAYYERNKRLKERISNILKGGESSFLTLTFTDDVLAITNEQTRRRYVARFCKSFGVDYVANIDYGKKNNREHYHAVVGCSIPSSTWEYGFMNAKPVRLDKDSSAVCLAKYITKLTNHAIKETTKRSCLIYSR